MITLIYLRKKLWFKGNEITKSGKRQKKYNILIENMK
jgi:hypothetical protein